MRVWCVARPCYWLALIVMFIYFSSVYLHSYHEEHCILNCKRNPHCCCAAWRCIIRCFTIVGPTWLGKFTNLYHKICILCTNVSVDCQKTMISSLLRLQNSSPSSIACHCIVVCNLYLRNSHRWFIFNKWPSSFSNDSKH